MRQASEAHPGSPSDEHEALAAQAFLRRSVPASVADLAQLQLLALGACRADAGLQRHAARGAHGKVEADAGDLDRRADTAGHVRNAQRTAATCDVVRELAAV